ncbi:LAGLIDADG family homing endonuclease [Zavarzinella formosa]|uniref:LAGLIDADG family homing endonuclease n=1 Tax=Zavarzinella formosa TaxID=360055 RepID=UPI0002DAE800|nr:LAGLIDADG family homing endonuclease [Zavarzinella formosa]
MPPKRSRPQTPGLFDDFERDQTVPPSSLPFVDRVGRHEPAPTFVERVRPPPESQPPAEQVEFSSGEKSKARDLLNAIRKLQLVESYRRPATPQERNTLSRFCGFGPVALSIFPNPATGEYKDETWKKLGDELNGLLSPVEYDSVKRTTFNAFYTSPLVIDAMHTALDRLGVPDNALVLEPGCGTANFFRPGKRYLGVEMDGISGRIAKLLHPDQDIRIENFRDTKLPPVDAVIGNVPFADVRLEHNGQKFALHDYFFAKSCDALKPGGVMALVTTHYTLDKQNASIREYLAERADFLGAIRLPSDAFKREGTSVVTDIVFMRKRSLDEPPNHVDPDWLATDAVEIDGNTVPINRYFVKHPGMVLGAFTGKKALYQGGYGVESSGDLAEQLKEAVGRLPKHESDALKSRQSVQSDALPHGQREQTFVPPPPERHVSEGSFFVHAGQIHQLVDGQSVPVSYGGYDLVNNGGLVGRRMTALIGLRDKARYVLRSQNEGWPDTAREDARRELNISYDRFRASYGPVNKTTFSESKDGTAIRRMPNLVKFREDPDAMLVMALEEYDETTGEAKKAPIMRKDVVGKSPPITSVTTAEEGLLVSLDHKGVVDLPYIAQLYGKSEQLVITELDDLIYRDPESNKWQTADAYLSGNVRTKLIAAEKAGVTQNIEALKAVQPEDVLPGDIDANLGAPWIPASDIQAFASQLFRVDPEAITASHLAKDAVWNVEGGYSAQRSVAVTADYGTSRANGIWLLDLAMNLKSPTIYDPDPKDPDKRVVNQQETLAAKEKQKAIKEQFRAWVFSDPDRTERLVRLYNDAFNNLRPRQFDGSHLVFPGMSNVFTLRPHQCDAVWRVMSGGNTLLAHTVGAGKAQPLDARVLTPTGWARMGHLRVGDEVIAGDGSVTTITGVHPQGEKQIVRVGFSDGTSTECCEEHLWLTQTYRERTAEQSGKRLGKVWNCAAPKVRTTAEIRDTLVSPHLGAKNHSIPMVGIVQLESQSVPLDPYFLGVLLGDGGLSGGSATLTNPDEEILQYVKLPENVGLSNITGGGRCAAWGFPMIDRTGTGAGKARNPLTAILDDLGLLGEKSGTKFIPECYKHNSAEVRLAILQGLLDTDGSVQKNGASTYYYTISQKLADDVTFLVQSLGGLVRLRIKERPTYRHKGELRVGQPCFILCISMPPEINPFRLSRKANLVRPKSSYIPRRYVVSVEPVGMKDARCITVSHPSHLYVTDDFIVTHNSAVQAAAAMKMRETGLAKKIMCVCPNHLLEQYAREFQHLYPNAKLLVATKDDLAKDRRKLLTAKIASGDWDAIIVTHSSFERIGLSREFQEQFLRDQIAEYDGLLTERSARRNGNRNIIKSIEKQKASREAKLKDLIAEDKKDSGLVFDELGIDYIFYDESASVKNAETASKMDRVAGIQTGGSERAFDMLMKASYLHKKHPGHGITFANGTPISNSMVELYTTQRYLDPEGLESRGIGHFDAWAATFGEVVESMEISPDGKTLKPRSRFARFVNLPELQQMFRSFADVQTAEMLNLPRPALKGGKPIIVACPMSDIQQRLQNELVERYDRIRTMKVDPREDNALAITTDGRKLALDARMLSASAGDFPESKVNALVGNVFDIWKNTTDTRGTQMVFSDIGINPTPWGYSAYEEVTRKLIDRGIPREQIAAIGEADTDAKKQSLFEKVRNGSVRVLIGSTAKLGTGTNVQKRLVALHHLDAPWKPAEVEQRDGRILRQGNTNAEVAVYRYVTEGSFDSFMWQTLETKARFISQVMTGESAVRRADDVAEQALSYAEVKAIASGNPAVLVLAEADAELQRLAVLRKSHIDEQYMARMNLRDLPQIIQRLDNRIADITTDMETVRSNDGLLIRGNPASETDLARSLKVLPELVDNTRRFPLGIFHGLAFGIERQPTGAADVYLEGRAFRKTALSREHQGTRAVMNALKNLTESYEEHIAVLRREREVSDTQLADYQVRLGKKFAHGSHLEELTRLRDELKASLSEKLEKQEGTSSAELAGKIRELMASHKAEASPIRPVARKQENPRLRRRVEAPNEDKSAIPAPESPVGL